MVSLFAYLFFALVSSSVYSTSSVQQSEKVRSRETAVVGRSLNKMVHKGLNTTEILRQSLFDGTRTRTHAMIAKQQNNKPIVPIFISTFQNKHKEKGVLQL